MRKIIPALLASTLLCMVFSASGARAAEKRLDSPDGAVSVIVSDDHGLNYRVELGGKVVLTNSPLGLEFKS